jgi:Type VI secretion system/phage-baseplate injector OB domain
VVTGYGGTYRATVVDDADPMQQHRLQVVVPEVYGDAAVWAVASLPVGPEEPLPAVGDVVWVSFEHGDTDYPVWEHDPGADEATAGYVGKYRGVVVGNDDPLQQGRVEVTVPEVDPERAWALPSDDDADHGEYPEIGAEVWIEYDNGDPAYPRWVGLA